MAAETDAGALLDWLRARYGEGVELREPPASRGEGFDSTIHLVQFTGDDLPADWARPLVMRIKSDAGRTTEAVREAAIQAWAADHGYPAPRVLHVFAPDELLDRPVQVMERAAGSLLGDAMLQAPWRIRRLLGAFAQLHARLHALPTDGFPADDDVLDRRLRLTRHVATALGHPGLSRALARVEAAAPELRAAPAVGCHGDFHPLNVLVAAGQMSVIDWTDAGLGDRHADVARTVALFQLATIAASSPVERRVLGVMGPRLARRYLRAYRIHAPVDDRRLAAWTPVHLLHGWAQALGLRDGAFDGAAPAQAHRLPPGFVDLLEHKLDAALAGLG